MKKTHSIIVVDRSGSMLRSAGSAVMGFNENVQQVKEFAQEDDHEIKVSLITFNGQVFEHFWAEDASEIQEATVEGFQPMGSTALFEALGYVLDRTLKEDDGETSYLITVISDGEDNAPGKYTPDMVKILSEKAQGTGRWTLSYIGYSPESAQEFSRVTAIPQGNIATWSNANYDDALRGLRASNACTRSYYSARSKGTTSVQSLYSAADALTNLSEIREPSVEEPTPVTTADLDNKRVDYFGRSQRVTL